MITRRCINREMRLRPDPDVRQAFLYCMGYALERTGVEMNELESLSTHHHEYLTDPEGRLPKFYQLFHSLLARSLNCCRRHWETFFAPGSYNAVVPESDDDALDKIVYVLTNCVAAGLVPYVRDWPLSSYSMEYGESIEVRRPNFFFTENMPEVVRITLMRPNIYPELDDRALRKLIRERVREREYEIRRRMRNEGRGFLGLRRVLRQAVTDTPSTVARRRGIRPQVAAKNKWARIEALQRNKDWLVEYEHCRDRYRDGARNVVFPAGTYWLRVHCGVQCHPT